MGTRFARWGPSLPAWGRQGDQPRRLANEPGGGISVVVAESVDGGGFWALGTRMARVTTHYRQFSPRGRRSASTRVDAMVGRSNHPATREWRVPAPHVRSDHSHPQGVLSTSRPSDNGHGTAPARV